MPQSTPTPPPAPAPTEPEVPMGGEEMEAPTPAEMDNAPMMDNGMPDMGEQPMDNAEGGDDKKKEIQKLAGELSEKLRNYNDENGTDEELNKYVKGMIDAQTSGESEGEEEEFDTEEDVEPSDSGAPEETEAPAVPEEDPAAKQFPTDECKVMTKKQLQEEFDSEKSNRKEKDGNLRMNKKISKANVRPNNPFIPPKFN